MAFANTKEADEALAQKEKELAELNEKLATALKRVDDAQEMIHRQAEDKGSDGKAIRDSAATIRRLGEELIEANKVVKELTGKVGTMASDIAAMKAANPGPNGDKATPTKPEPTADEIEAGLNAQEQAKLDEAWKNADEQTRKRIKADDAFRKSFMLLAKESAKADSESDLSSWRKTPAQKNGGSNPNGDESLRKLFKGLKSSAEFVPDGHGGTTRPAVRRPQGNESPKADWVAAG